MNETENKQKLPLDQRVVTDFPKYIATSMADQIKNADTKAFGTISIIGITTAALLSRLSALKSINGGMIDQVWLTLFGLSVLFILLALKAAVSVVYPRFSKPTKTSLTYFGDISSMTREEFLAKGKEMDFDSIVRETYSNAYNLAGIADKKFKALRKAMLFTLLALIWGIGVILFS